jgi:uncharacterized protein (DUF2141 family)
MRFMKGFRATWGMRHPERERRIWGRCGTRRQPGTNDVQQAAAVLALSLALVSAAYAAPRRTSLTVILKGFSPTKGTIHVGLYNNEHDFDGRLTIRGVNLPAAARPRKVTFANLPRGRYAVAVYQDVNGNGRLDKYPTGYPSEPFGFSQNPLVVFGPPLFSKCVVEVTARPATISIHPQ